MTIGEEGLAALLRQTASNIIKSYRIAKNTYRKPNLLRRQIIEEICNRHAGSRNGLFADILSQ
jgi:prepilin-type processing-associated H-X9-DG protein